MCPCKRNALREYNVFWIPWSTGCVFLRHALQCGLLHLWVRDLMVSLLTGHLEGVGVLGGPLSPRCRRGWSFTSGKSGVGKERG